MNGPHAAPVASVDGIEHVVHADGGALAAALARASTHASALAHAAVLRRLQVHLHLVASLLVPAWRDARVDGWALEIEEVQLASMQRLARHAGELAWDDPLADARLVVLEQDLRGHLARTTAWLALLHERLGAERAGALAADWRGMRDERLGQHGGEASSDLDNEDADPVGTPPA